MDHIFYEVDYTISNSVKNELVNITNNNAHKWRNLGPALSSYVLQDTSVIKDLLDSVKRKPSSCVILISPPDAIIKPHIDGYPDPYSRTSCVSWALSPDLENFAPTVFYDKDHNVIHRHYYTEKGFILNTKILHGMINNNHCRYMLQFLYVTRADVLKDVI